MRRRRILCAVGVILVLAVGLAVRAALRSHRNAPTLPGRFIVSNYLNVRVADIARSGSGLEDGQAIANIRIDGLEPHAQIMSHALSRGGRLALGAMFQRRDPVTGSWTLSAAILVADKEKTKFSIARSYSVPPDLPDIISHISWSPDDKRVAFILNQDAPTDDEEDPALLGILDVATGDIGTFPVGRVWRGPHGGRGPNWDADSRRVILSNGVDEVFLYDDARRTIERTELRGCSAQWGLEPGEVFLCRERGYLRIDLASGKEKASGRMPRTAGDWSPTVYLFPEANCVVQFSGTTYLSELIRGIILEHHHVNYWLLDEPRFVRSIHVGGPPNPSLDYVADGGVLPILE